MADGLRMDMREQRNGVVHIELRGEFDLASIESFEERIRKLEELGPELIILDARNLDFCDSQCLRQFILAHQRATEARRKVVIALPKEGPVFKTFHIAGLLDRLPVTYDPSEHL